MAANDAKQVMVSDASRAMARGDSLGPIEDDKKEIGVAFINSDGLYWAGRSKDGKAIWSNGAFKIWRTPADKIFGIVSNNPELSGCLVQLIQLEPVGIKKRFRLVLEDALEPTT